MSTAATLNTGLAQSDATQATQIVRGAIALSGNYGDGATSGDPLNLAKYGVQSNRPPLRVLIYEMPPAGTAPTGYVYVYEVGTDPSNGRISILGTGAAAGDPLQEYTLGAAYSAGLLAAALFFEAVFPLGN
jgi:hypothetical protein